MADTDIILYPHDHILGIIDDHEKADAALADLNQRGVAEQDITVLTGEEGAARIDAHGTRHGLLTRFLRAIQFATMDALPDAEDYEQAALRGNFVLAIRVHGTEQRDLVHKTLREHGAHFINYYGKLASMPLEEGR
jgi:hypothetical protein